VRQRRVVVCGATGQQGGAVLRHALQREGWEVVALSREPEGEKARRWSKEGAQVVRADLEDRDSLIRAFQGADYVFGLTQPWSPDYRKCHPEREVEQGRNITEACRETGVKLLVMSSAAHLAEGKTGIPHVDSKLEVEAYVSQSGVPFTFIRPVQFMDNLGSPFFPIRRGSIRGFVDGKVRVPYVAVDDIGAFAALIFDGPEGFIGQGLDLVGDFISGEELCLLLSRLRGGERFRYRSVPRWLMKLWAKEFYAMRLAFEEFGKPPYREDIWEIIAACRKFHPGLMSMEAFLLAQGFDTRPL
jgi:uncharacterized protein YbjT (DUF2867 family)